MNKLKVAGIFIGILLLLLLIVIGIRQNVSNTVNGIQVSGGSKDSDWTVEGDGSLLYILSDGITLKGTAKEDLRIVYRQNVSELTIEDLKQGDKVLTISTISESNAEDTT